MIVALRLAPHLTMRVCASRQTFLNWSTMSYDQYHIEPFHFIYHTNCLPTKMMMMIMTKTHTYSAYTVCIFCFYMRFFICSNISHNISLFFYSFYAVWWDVKESMYIFILYLLAKFGAIALNTRDTLYNNSQRIFKNLSRRCVYVFKYWYVYANTMCYATDSL